MNLTTTMPVRIAGETKHKAAETLATLGLSLSDAVRLFLKRVVIEQRLPLSLKIPNAATRTAMQKANAISKLRFQNVGDLIHDIEKNRIKDAQISHVVLNILKGWFRKAPGLLRGVGRSLTKQNPRRHTARLYRALSWLRPDNPPKGRRPFGNPIHSNRTFETGSKCY